MQRCQPEGLQGHFLRNFQICLLTLKLSLIGFPGMGNTNIAIKNRKIYSWGSTRRFSKKYKIYLESSQTQVEIIWNRQTVVKLTGSILNFTELLVTIAGRVTESYHVRMKIIGCVFQLNSQSLKVYVYIDYVTLPETSSRGSLIPKMIQVCDYDILIVLVELNKLK